MYYKNDKAFDVKIAYIGGGSRGWARGLMSDLAMDGRLNGTVCLYDIDGEAAEENSVIGNKIEKLHECKAEWKYVVENDITVALTGADFVVISILPGTFDEMESDVHLPEKYGIYQSVGDTIGPGGIVRALRTIPIYEEFAKAIKEYCPNAWVINFTNPMTMCVRTLYKVFPQIKAFGCCHEVFGTQVLISKICKEKLNLDVDRDDIKINVLGVNHFTWVDSARYKDLDLMPVIREYAKENLSGADSKDENWANADFKCTNQVKFDLFKRYGVLAAAGDRHLAEFCPGSWYLHDPETVEKFGFNLTTVKWRKEDLARRLEKTRELLNGKEFELVHSGEESVRQIKALLGIGEFVTNVNIPNYGQMEGVPIGAVVETNAYFSGDSVRPLYAGALPQAVNSLVAKVSLEQETVVTAALDGDYEMAFNAFLNDANVNLPIDKARELFDKMLENTKSYLPYYDAYKMQEKSSDIRILKR